MSKSETNRKITFSTSAIQDKPKIDVVLQATGNHAWNMSEGWINTLRREGLLNRAFRPVANWEAAEPIDDDGLYEYLENPQADIILLLGFDWHSQPLHKTLRWQTRWLNTSIKKIAILNEECSSDTVGKSSEWQQLVFAALDSSIPCVDAIICNHETDVEFLRNKRFVTKPIVFQPFAIDTEYFNSNIDFQERFNKAFFRGRITNFYGSNSYEKRKLLVDRLIQCEEVCLKNYDEKLTLEDYIKDLAQYQILINLPSISLTLTARVFEILGCGGTLLQNSIVATASNLLFKNWEHLVYYDNADPDDLIAKLKYLIKNPEVSARIAENGHELCRKEHSIQCRIQAILKWTDNGFNLDNTSSCLLLENELGCGEKITTSLAGKGEKFPTIVLDSVFFQINQTGIARVWNSVLAAWSKSDFASHIVILDRDHTAPIFPGFRYRNIERYDYQKTGLDAQMLQFVCDEVGADLFISTYYTTPVSTPSVFMAYDMIPEVIGADLTDQMWQEKQHGIVHACRYITISQSTADDLIRFFPHVSSELVTVAHCGITTDIAQIDITKVTSFKIKYNIKKPYFLLVGSRLNLDSYKNAILFFKALDRYEQKDQVVVICVGGEAILEPELAKLAGKIPVHLLKLDDTELKAAYAGAISLIYPSLYEGFGLPIAEAMAYGCPVITCRNSSIPEVAGAAAIYVDEYRVEEMIAALSKVQIPEVRQLLIELGFAQSQQFTWTKMAKTIANVLLETASQLQDQQHTQLGLVWQEFRKMQSQFQQLSSAPHLQELLNVPVPARHDILENSRHEDLRRLEIQLGQKQQDLLDAESIIVSMQSTKFWKLRSIWFQLKPFLFPVVSLMIGLSLLLLCNPNYTGPNLFQLMSWFSQQGC